MADWQHFTIWISILLLAIKRLSAAGVEEVCSGENFRASCQPGEVVLMESAEYGRMEPGRCGVTQELGHVGCRNDFLFLLDEKCSGKRECMLVVGGSEFYDANTQCIKELLAYLRVSYQCIQVEYKDRSHCLIPKSLPLFPQEGFIASHVTDETGCGTTRTPWTIQAMPGQTINFTILDFGALSPDRSSHYVKCQDTYGYLIERSLSVNESICGSTRRQRTLYSSATHSAEIQLIPKNRRRDESLFIIRYRVVGCSDLTPPADSYYTREGNKAVIGCENIPDTSWELVCNGNTWDGMVGNCTAKMAAVATQKESVPMKPLLIVAAIVGATVVIAVLIIVSGVVYIKRYRHAEEIKTSTMQWTLHYKPKADITALQPHRGGTYRPMTCTHARQEPPSTSRAPTLAKPRRPPPSTGTGKPLQHIWEMPLPDPHANANASATAKKDTPSEGIYMNPTECTCNTTPNPLSSMINPNNPPIQPLPPSEGATGMVGDGDDISSFYAPNTGHKYYVLERQDHLQQAQTLQQPEQ